MTFLLKIGFLSDWWQMSSGLVKTIWLVDVCHQVSGWSLFFLVSFANKRCSRVLVGLFFPRRMSSRVLRRWVVIEQWVLHFHLVGLAILQALQNLVGIYKSSRAKLLQRQNYESNQEVIDIFVCLYRGKNVFGDLLRKFRLLCCAVEAAVRSVL